MIQHQINYKEVIDLGFKRKDLGNDSVFFNQYGFEWFIVIMKLKKGIYAEWDCTTKEVELVHYEKENVIGRMPIVDLEHLKKMITFFKGEKKVETNYQTYA